MRKFIATLLSAALLATLCGCWDYSEIRDNAIIAGFSVDRSEDDERILLVGMEVLATAADKSAPVEAKILKSQGHTIADALGNATLQMSNHPFMGHCKLVVVSEEIAREGLDDLLNMIMRDERFIMSITIAVAPEGTAEEVLSATPMLTDITSYDINKSLVLDKRYVGKASNLPAYQIFNQMGNYNHAYVLSTIKIIEQEDGPLPRLSGGAVFKQNKLVGYLSIDQVQEYLMASNQLSSGSITFTKDDNNQFITTHIENSSAVITPSITEDGPAAALHLSLTLAADETTIDYSDKLLEDLERQVVERTEELLELVQQELRCDIFGFSQAFAGSNYASWQKLEPYWEVLFPQMPVEVSCQVEIANLGQFE